MIVLIDVLIRAKVSLFSEMFLSLRVGNIGTLLEAMIDFLLNKRMVFDGEVALLILEIFGIRLKVIDIKGGFELVDPRLIVQIIGVDLF